MRILITGINGFVGSNFTKHWQSGHTLYGLDINKHKQQGVEKMFLWNELDKIPRLDAIIHLAGIAHDTKDKTKSDIYFNVNTGLTQKIFDYYLRSKATKFVFFSSVKAAADKVEGSILTEKIVPRPVGAYGESKIKAEEYILNKKDTWGKLEKSVFIVRPTMIHGEGNKGNLNLLYKVVNKGIPWPLASFKNKRSFLSVDNLVFFISSILENKKVESGIYHLADDETVSTNKLIGIIAGASGKKARLWRLPAWLILTISKVGDKLRLPLNSERLQKLTENYIVSNQKIKTVLGIEKLPLTAEEGLIKTIKSFKN